LKSLEPSLQRNGNDFFYQAHGCLHSIEDCVAAPEL
jgi:hypothetical protein